MRILVVVGALWCVACFARVEPEPTPAVEPDGTVEQAYADDTCAARPVAIVRGKAPADIVTSEAGWHYDGSDPKVRRYSTPLDLARACWRDDGPTGCTCRGLEVDERAYGL
jgi:hypothetical protein